MSDPADDLAALAASALDGIAPAGSVGPLVDAVEREPGVVDLAFDCLLPGYPGWRWTVSTARLEGEAPTVLETELLPGDGSLLAPPWVPWTERLAEYRRTHGETAGDTDEQDDEQDDDLDDELEEQDDEDDEDDEDEDEDDGLEDEDDGLDDLGMELDDEDGGPEVEASDEPEPERDSRT